MFPWRSCRQGFGMPDRARRGKTTRVDCRKCVLSFGSTRRSCSVVRLRLLRLRLVRRCRKYATSFDNSCVLRRLLRRLLRLLRLLRRLRLLRLRLRLRLVRKCRKCVTSFDKSCVLLCLLLLLLLLLLLRPWDRLK